MKMYITQLRGVFEKISDNNEEKLEEVGRRIAQTILSEGDVYLHGFGRASFIINEATQSDNALPKAKPLFDGFGVAQTLSQRDTLLLFAWEGDEPQIIECLNTFSHSGADLIGIFPTLNLSTTVKEAFDTLLTLPESHPLVPLDNDIKRGNPESLALIFLYHLIYFSVLDILNEQDLLED